MKVGKRYAFSVAHNLLLAHGRAVQVIRAYAKKTPKIGFAPALNYVMPDSNSSEDILAAKKSMFTCYKEDGLWCTPWWLEPVYHGKYPEDGLVAFAEWLPDIQEGDMEIINQPLNFFGFNYYHARRLSGIKTLGGAETAVEWPVEPEGIYYMSKFL